MTKCVVCGESDDLTRTCNYCGKKVCTTHTLPEKHNCSSVRSANDAGKHFENAFDATLGDASSSSDGSPDSMDKGSVRTYGTAEAVENLDSSPPVETKSDSNNDVEKELAEIKWQQRLGSSLAAVIVPVVMVWQWTTSMLSVRLLAVCLIGVATVGQLGVVGVPGFPVDTSPAESIFEDTGGAVTNATDETTRPSAGETTRASTESSTDSGGSNLFGDDLNRTRIEYLIHERINDRRQEHGLQPLAFDTDLREIARYHSRDMAEKQYFDHTAPDGETMEDRYAKYDYSCRVSVSGNRYATGAENIAYTYAFEDVLLDDGGTVYLTNETELARFFVAQWMNSTGHRKNILRDYWKNEGIGVSITDSEGETKVYATQSFC